LTGASDFHLIHHEDDGRRRLERWRRNVGAPVALNLASTQSCADSLLVLSWNVWIGRGRLADLVSQLRDGDFRQYGADPDLPLVVLIQEAFRSDDTVPRTVSGSAGRVLVAGLGPQEDVVETAHSLQLNLRYAPSMRNGVAQSDRGNAILSSLPLEDAHAIELPLVLQRRVAVSAALTLGSVQLRLVSAHLDPRGPPGHRWLGASGRALQARHLAGSVHDDTVILGADLNLARGRYERAWRLLADAGYTFGVPPTLPRWRHTYHAIPRLVLDYLLIRDRQGRVRQGKVQRLDEHPRDRGPFVFGSDHHPLIARIDFHPSAGRAHE
jgi:endonuclease/exonuclease/phosphatase family metal-dependent hydrolase